MEKKAFEIFLKKKHVELSVFLSENMSFEQTKEAARIYAYKLGQYDVITEICHKAMVELDHEK
jgi:hypothetical protein